MGPRMDTLTRDPDPALLVSHTPEGWVPFARCSRTVAGGSLTSVA